MYLRHDLIWCRYNVRPTPRQDPPERLEKNVKNQRICQCIREFKDLSVYSLTCLISIMMLMILYEEYVKNLKKTCKCAHGGAYRPPEDTQPILS